MQKIVIDSPEAYEAAMKRIQELSGAPAETPEEHGLIKLIEAADAWDRGKGGEAAGETPDAGQL